MDEPAAHVRPAGQGGGSWVLESSGVLTVCGSASWPRRQGGATTIWTRAPRPHCLLPATSSSSRCGSPLCAACRLRSLGGCPWQTLSLWFAISRALCRHHQAQDTLGELFLKQTGFSALLESDEGELLWCEVASDRLSALRPGAALLAGRTPPCHAGQDTFTLPGRAAVACETRA